MRCQKCNAEWTLGNSQEKRRITVCPFCGAKLFIKDTIESLVWSLVLEYGKELYQQENELRFTGLLSDFAGDFPKAVKTLKIAIAEHIPAALLACDGKNNEEKLLSMRLCKDKLTEDVGLAQDRATKALNTLAHGLDWELQLVSEANIDETNNNPYVLEKQQQQSERIVCVEKSNSGLSVACFIGWLAFVIAFVCAINNYLVADRYEVRLLEYNELKEKYNDLMSHSPYVVITNAGVLNYSNGKKLEFDFKIYSDNYLEEDLKVKVIDPWGTIIRRKTSPNGYTFSCEGQRTQFWTYNAGYDYNYAKGKYKIEVCYKDQCVGSKVVEILR